MMRRTPLKRSGWRRKAGKRARKVKTSTLKKTLWRVFSEFIRKRDADHAGYASCVSCGDSKLWKYQQAGHYVRASAGMVTRFDERNVNTQCLRCNVFLDGNIPPYAIFMVKTYGPEILEELDALRRQNFKPSTDWYLEKISEYTKKLEAL